MFYNNAIWMAKNENPIYLLPPMANRHGLVTGATGTGKTITIKVMAEAFSDAGVSVLLSDIKGDLTGMSVPGINSEDMQKRIEKFGLAEAGWEYKSYPTTYWDVFGKKGTPIRATVTEMGPMLLSRLMGLSDVQEGVLTIIFKIADDQGLLILDLKDLRAVVQAVGDHAADYKTSYGNITTASIGAIQRGLLKLEEQGANQFFGEPALDIKDWIRTDENGRGMVNVLNCEELFQQPDLYAAFLLWMLSELYETLPEAGDLEKPKIVFFFDEAHILFDLDSKALLSKVEQVVRLIRSKGVGVYFISQSPTDIPNTVLGQLGNKIQHALRAYTPADQKAVRAAAQSFVVNPEFSTEEAITQLGTGEALVSFLNEKGAPTMVQRAKILPPQSLMGGCDPEILANMVASGDMGLKYNSPYDRMSAYEMLMGTVQGYGQEVQQPRFDPMTGQPIAPQPRFDPYTGKPIENVQPQARFDPMTGQPLAAGAAAAAVGGAPSLVQSNAAQRQADLNAQYQTQQPNLAQSQNKQNVTLTEKELEKLKKDAVKEAKKQMKEEKEKEKKREQRKKTLSKAASSVLTSASKTAANKLVRGVLGNLLK